MPDTTATGGLCQISGTDLVGYVGSLWQRVAELEQRVAQLSGYNLTAQQLSDISELAGLITGGGMIFPSEPWAGPGGSIPVPDGFTGTVVSGNVITTWNNGVVTFEVIPGTGLTTGGGGVKGFIEFDCDDISSLGNIPSTLNSVIDSYGDLTWISYILGQGIGQIKFNSSGIYAASFQAGITGIDSGVEMRVLATFLEPAYDTSGIMYGGSVVNPNVPRNSYLNMSTIFEMPNTKSGLTTGIYYSYTPYLQAMPVGGGTHEFGTYDSVLRIAKLV